MAKHHYIYFSTCSLGLFINQIKYLKSGLQVFHSRSMVLVQKFNNRSSIYSRQKIYLLEQRNLTLSFDLKSTDVVITKQLDDAYANKNNELMVNLLNNIFSSSNAFYFLKYIKY